MIEAADWNGQALSLAESRGGVRAVGDYSRNLIRAGVAPWPPPEIVQKLYKSNQESAFGGEDLELVRCSLGYYCDLQSLHSEDALTWSCFGPLVYAGPEVRSAFATGLLRLLGVPAVRGPVHLWLWRRTPHPDTLVPGGPEIDFGIQTADLLILGEAKWLSAVGARQGRLRDQDQIQLRRALVSGYAQRLFPGVRRAMVLGVDLSGSMVASTDDDLGRLSLHSRCLSWDSLAKLECMPHQTEFARYLQWKRLNSRLKPSASSAPLP